MLADQRIVQRFGGVGQRMVGCDGEYELHGADDFTLQSGDRAGFHGQADEGQIGLARSERLKGAVQGFVAKLEAGRRLQCKEVFAQLHHGGPVDDAVHRDGELRLPTGGHPPDAIGHRVDVREQSRTFAQQFGPRFGEPGLARAAVEQQHVEGVLHLAHPVGECAGHHVAGACRRGKAAGAGNGLQHGQRVGGENVACGRHGIPFHSVFLNDAIKSTESMDCLWRPNCSSSNKEVQA